MQEVKLLEAIGSEALSELTQDEKAIILGKFSDDQIYEAAMFAFSLLMKKYRPSYRMGRMYEELGQKYEFYYKLYVMYANMVKAGKK